LTNTAFFLWVEGRYDVKSKKDIREQITDALRQIALGQVSDPVRLMLYGGDETNILPLCRAAVKELEPLIKPGADCEDIRLINLGAALVNYRLTVRQSFAGDFVSSFRAGDVTVKGDSAAPLKAAKQELSSAFAAAAPLLRDSSFMFAGVKV